MVTAPLGVLPYLSGTQSRNQSNAPPPPGDRMLFKSASIPLLSPTLPQDAVSGGGGVKVAVFLLGNPLYGLYRYVPLDRQAMVPAPM